MTQEVVYLGEYSVCDFEKSEFSALEDLSVNAN